MFNHVEGYDPISLPTETINGKRYYITPEGNKYPSVTTVTGLLNRVWLKQWKKKVGEKKANKIAGKAANRGTRYHQIQEDFINNKLTEEMIKKITPLDLMMFNQTKTVTQGLGDIYMLEGSMYSNELRMAGRVDCIAEYAGALSVIDFKTSTRAKYPSSIKNYFMQETCYALMFEEMYGKKIEKIVTIIAVEETGQAQLFVEEPSNWIEDVKILREQYRTEYGI
jgi:genome maintenance exonuclease 1